MKKSNLDKNVLELIGDKVSDLTRQSQLKNDVQLQNNGIITEASTINNSENSSTADEKISNPSKHQSEIVGETKSILMLKPKFKDKFLHGITKEEGIINNSECTVVSNEQKHRPRQIEHSVNKDSMERLDQVYHVSNPIVPKVIVAIDNSSDYFILDKKTTNSKQIVLHTFEVGTLLHKTATAEYILHRTVGPSKI